MITMHPGVQVLSQHGSLIPDWVLQTCFKHHQSPAGCICDLPNTARYTGCEDRHF